MAGKVVGFRIKLEGEKATLDALNAVKDALGKNGKAIDEINKKADALDKTTRRVIELTKALSELNKVQPIIGVPNVPRVTINNRPTGTPTPTNTTDDREEKEKRYQAELLKTLRIQEQQLKELALLGDKESQTYKDLLLNVAKSKIVLSELTKEIKAQQREFEGVKIASGSYRQLNAELGRLRAAYKDLSEAERNGAIGRETLQSIVKLDRELKKLDANIGLYQRNVGNYASAFNNLSTVAQRVSGVFGIAFGLDEVIRNNAQLSDSLGDVRRVTQLSQKSVEDLYNSLRKIDTRTSLDGLLQISVIGGKLGVSEKNLAGFAEAANKLQVALGKELGDNVEETTTKLAKLVTIFDKDKTVTGDKLIALGNGIAYLANKGTATGEFLADFSNRLAGLSGIANISLGQTLGLGAGFQELGQSAEVSSTAVNALILKIGQDIPKFAGLAGKSVEEFSKTINEKPVEALLQLSEGLVKNKTGFVEISKEFKEAEAGGKRIASTLGVLGKNAELFRGKIIDGSAALLRQNELLAAYEIKNQTAGAALDKLKKSIIDVTTSTEFQKFLFDVISGLAKFIQVLGALPKFISENKTELYALAVAYLTLNKSLADSIRGQITGSAAYKFLTSATERQTIATNILGAAQRALPILLVIAAVYGLVKVFNAATAAVNANTVATDALSDAQKEISEETGKASGELRRNIEILKSSITTDEQKQKAIAALQSQYPEYLRNIDLQSAGSLELNKIENDLNATLERQAAIKAKGAAQDKVLTKIIQNKDRIDAIREGAAPTNEEQLRRGVFNVAQITNNKEEIAKGVISIIEKDNIELEKSLNILDDRFNKRYNTEKNRTQSIVENKDLENYYNGVGKSIEKSSGVSENVGKAEKKRREKAAKEIQKEENERQKFERAAAENIFRIRKELADKTFDFQKKEAALEFQEATRKIENERNDAEKKLSGTASEVAAQRAIYKGLYDTQIDLSGKLLQKRNNDINKAYEAARAAALKDIEESRREFELKQANNTVKNIEATGKAQNRVFQLETVTTNVKFDNKEAQLRADFEKKADFTKGAEKELTRQLKQITIERELELQAIEQQKFEFNKTQRQTELTAQLTAIDERSKAELTKIDENERVKRAKIDEEFRDKLISVEEYQKALDILTSQSEADRAQVETDATNESADLAAKVAIESIDAEQDLANKKVKISKDTNEQLLANAKQTADNERAIQAARLDFLQAFVGGAKDLLGQDESTRKKYSGVIKALALAEIAINLQRELSAIAVAAAANPTNALTFGIAGVTQYTVQSGVAIIRAAFAAAKVLTSKFQYGGVEPSSQKSDSVQGGSIPSESGVIQGKSHTEGGVKVKNRYGNLYEVEGGEYRLRNGRETYIINKESTRRYKSELDTLSKILRPTIFSAKRKEIASAINSQNGVKFAQGGIAPNDIPQFNTPQIGAPLPPTQQNVTVVNTSIETSQEVIDMLSETQRMIEAVNSRIDRIVVINKPEEVYEQALLQKEIRSTQNL